MRRWHPDGRVSNNGTPSFLIDYNISWQSVDLFIARRNQQGEIEVAKEIEFAPHDPAKVMHQPTLRVSDCEGTHPFQGLFDALWEAGYRPKEEVLNVEPIVKAKDSHLDDLRTILFSQMGIKK